MDHEALAARAFDEPYDDELRATVRVCGDALEQASDPRGALIALEHALLDAASPQRVRELRGAIHAHAFAHGAELLGPAARLEPFARAITLDWRAGRIYGAALDLRYVAKMDASIAPHELVDLLLEAPAARWMRRLRVRARKPADLRRGYDRLRQRTPRPPLEELELGRRVWPTAMGYNEHGAPLEAYPNLYFFAQGDEIEPLLPAPGDARAPDQRAADLARLGPPTEPRARALLGRALCSPHMVLRAAALRQIARLGASARGFARALTILLQPGLTTGSWSRPPLALLPQRPVVETIRALGPSRELAAMLARVASRASAYDAETRRAAGAAAAEMRGRSAR